jgi:hypothetical protein
MKTKLPLTASFTFFCLVQALAQPFAIDWSTIDGGGGTSTGGVYSVSGTSGHNERRKLFAHGWFLEFALHRANARRAAVVDHIYDDQRRADFLAISFNRFQPATEHECCHDKLGDAFRKCHRQRHEQIHHHQSTHGQSVLSFDEAVKDWVGLPVRLGTNNFTDGMTGIRSGSIVKSVEIISSCPFVLLLPF